jgi:hypothetical protein
MTEYLVAVEKLHFLPKWRKIGDRKCLSKPRKSFVGGTLVALNGRVASGMLDAQDGWVPTLFLGGDVGTFLVFSGTLPSSERRGGIESPGEARLPAAREGNLNKGPSSILM